MKKIIYIVIDSPSGFSGKLPLYLNQLYLFGKAGAIKPLVDQESVESGSAIFSLLGFDSNQYPTLRGPLEAFACGINLQEGEVAMRANFAAAEDDLQMIKDRKAGGDLTDDEAAALSKEINSKITLSSAGFEFISTSSHRGILILRGMHHRLSGMITNTDPAYRRHGVFELKCRGFKNTLLESSPLPEYANSLEARETAVLLNEFTRKVYKILSVSQVNKKRLLQNQLPANILLLRGAGDRLIQPPLLGTIYNLKFGFLARTPLERALAGLSGMEFVDLPSLTGHADVDYSIYAKIALDSLERFDCVFVRIKADGELVAEADKYFFGSLIKGVDLQETVIAVVNQYSQLILAGGKVKNAAPWQAVASSQVMPLVLKMADLAKG